MKNGNNKAIQYECVLNMSEIQNNSNVVNQNSDSPDIENKEKRIAELKQVYQLAIKTRDFEISNLIHRNNFYMLFQGVLLASALATEASKPYVELIICLCGIAVSWFQIGASAGAKYWQEYWEMKVDGIEKKLSEYFPDEEFIWLFKHNDEDFRNELEGEINKDTNKLIKKLVLKKFSVSRQPIYTAVALLITWVVLFFQTINLNQLDDEQKLFGISLSIQGLYFHNVNDKQNDCEDSKTQCHKTNTE